MPEHATFLRPLPAGPAPSRQSAAKNTTVKAAGVEFDALSTPAILLFLAAHIPLALLFKTVGAPLSTAHALVVFAFGATSAIRRRVDRVVMVVGYIAGAEVLWRMTNAQILWESGKYASAAIMLLALIRNGLIRPPALPLAYFALLLPSCVLTVSQENWPAASNQLSFNLSGPLALMVSAWFFSTMQLSARQFRALFVAMIGPSISVLTLAVYGTLTTANLSFIDQSNLATSGGYGPNQVSAVLGLGALLCLLVATSGGTRQMLRFAMGALIVAFAVQCSLTFSRGGLAAAAGSAAIAACFSAKDSRVRSRLLPLVAALLTVGYLLMPYLDAYTGGELSVRFGDASLTGRDYMARQEFELFAQNPIFGVGPGGARVERMGLFSMQGGPRMVTSLTGVEYAAHTEYARLLSEHGSFGLAALLLLVFSTIVNLRRVADPVTRGLVAALLSWSALFMMSSAMRLFLPSLTFGIAFATLVADQSPPAQARAGAQGMRRLTSGHRSRERVESRTPTE